jgi:hypothetical protein
MGRYLAINLFIASASAEDVDDSEDKSSNAL